MAKKNSKLPSSSNQSTKKNSLFDYLLIISLVVGAGYLAYIKFFTETTPNTSTSSETERRRFGEELIPINPSDNLKRGLPRDFVTFSKRPTPEETRKITSLFNEELGLSLDPFNVTAESIFNYSTISDCNTFDNFLDLGIVDPFIHACFQRKQNDLQILYQQKKCSYAGFLITSKAGPSSVEGLNDGSISILGKGRVRVLAKSTFPKNGPIKFKNVYVDQNPSRAQAEVVSMAVGAFYVLGFKINDRFSIPFLNISNVEELESINPSLKLIEKYDYNLPCNVVVASQSIADSMTDEQKNHLLEKLNHNSHASDLFAITSQPNNFEAVDHSKLNKDIMDNIITMLNEEINTDSVGIRGYQAVEKKGSIDFNSEIEFNSRRDSSIRNQSTDNNSLETQSDNTFDSE